MVQHPGGQPQQGEDQRHADEHAAPGLFTGEDARYAEARAVLAAGASAPGHVVNLGHGVPPETDPAVLTDLVAFLHAQSA